MEQPKGDKVLPPVMRPSGNCSPLTCFMSTKIATASSTVVKGSVESPQVGSYRQALRALSAKWLKIIFVMQYLGYARTGVWLWTLVSTSAIGVAIWAYLARLPLVIVAVLA